MRGGNNVLKRNAEKIEPSDYISKFKKDFFFNFKINIRSVLLKC